MKREGPLCRAAATLSISRLKLDGHQDALGVLAQNRMVAVGVKWRKSFPKRPKFAQTLANVNIKSQKTEEKHQ